MAFSRVTCVCITLSLLVTHFTIVSPLKIETPNFSREEYKTFLNSIWDVVSTLGADTPDLSIKKSDTPGIDLEFSTESDFKYHVFPVWSTSLKFAVKASSDVYIAFSSKPFETNSIELVIGEANNTKTSFQRNHVTKEVVNTPGILHGGEYRRFLVRWGDGVILVWRTGEHRPFISWMPPKAAAIGYIGIRSGSGVSGSWQIEDLAVGDGKTSNRRDNFVLQFRVKTANDAHVGLFTKPALFQGQMIEIVIGGWSNTKSIIRRGNYRLNDVAIVEIPGLLNASEYRGFWLHWGDVISVGREGEHCPFMSWPDPEPFQVTHLGIHTGFGASGSWKIEDWEESQTPDSVEYKYQPFAALGALSDSSSAAIDSW